MKMNKSYESKNDVSSSGYDDSESEAIETNEESSLQNVLTARGYKGLKVQKKICTPEIDSDEEEVYLLRIPKSIDPKVLENAKLSLNKPSKVKTESGIYSMKPLDDGTEPKYFMQSNGLKKIKPVSMLQLEKFVTTPHKNTNLIEENEIQQAPNNLKPRHLIFGAEYQERIKLEEEIQKKLQEALKRFDSKKEVPKQKKKKSLNSDDLDDKSLLISQILEAKFKDKKSGKKDHENSQEKIKNNKDSFSNKIETEIEATNSEQNSENHTPKKHKKHSKSDKIDSKRAQDYDDNQVSPEIKREKVKKKKDHKRIKTENLMSLENSNEQDRTNNSIDHQNTPEKIKKKKDRSNSSKIKIENSIQTEPSTIQGYTENSINLQNTHENSKKKKDHSNSKKIKIEVKQEILSDSEIVDLNTTESKKRKRDSDIIVKQEIDDSFLLPPVKKRKPSLLSSTVINEGSPNFQFDISNIQNESKAEKKKKKQNKLNTDDIIDETSIDVKPDVSTLVIEEKIKKKKKKKKHGDHSGLSESGLSLS